MFGQSGSNSYLSACFYVSVNEKNKKGTPQRHALYSNLALFYLFFALNFAHLARCAAAIRSRAAADNLRRPPFLPTPLNAAIARSSLSRSFFNCATIAPRSVICILTYRGRFNNKQTHDIERWPFGEYNSLPRTQIHYGPGHLSRWIVVGRIHPAAPVAIPFSRSIGFRDRAYSIRLRQVA